MRLRRSLTKERCGRETSFWYGGRDAQQRQIHGKEVRSEGIQKNW